LIKGLIDADDAEMSPGPMSPLTLPKRASIFSLGGGTGAGSSLRRMSTAKVSRSTDALLSLDDPAVAAVDAPPTPVSLARSRRRMRASFLSLFRPTPHGAGRRAATQPAAPRLAAAGTAAAAAAARGRRPSDSAAEVCRASAADEDRCSGRRAGSGTPPSSPPPALPRRPAHLLQLPSTPTCAGTSRPLPLLPLLPPTISTRRSSPLLHAGTVRVQRTKACRELAQ